MRIEIASDVPMPEGRKRLPRADVPLDALAPGQSFFVEVATGDKWVHVRALRYGRASGRRFRVLRTVEAGKRGVRVWRDPADAKEPAAISRDGPMMPAGRARSIPER